MTNTAIEEANREGAVHLLIGALARGLGEILVHSVGDEGARSTLQRVVLDAQAAGE